MGVMVTASTIEGGVTPVCNRCGIALCWDLADHEYLAEKEFWDNWQCRNCNPNYRGALKRFRNGSSRTTPSHEADFNSPKLPQVQGPGLNQERQAMKTVDVFIDGACSGNPGPGGWGAILRYGKHVREISGFEADTTNNRMELTAAIASLLMIKEPCLIHVYTDSKYVQEGMTRHIHKWKVNGWQNSNREPVKNRDLWEVLSEASKMHEVSWNWVQGHNGHRENERADRLARLAIEKARRQI